MSKKINTKNRAVTFVIVRSKYNAEISNGLGPYLGLIDMKNR